MLLPAARQGYDGEFVQFSVNVTSRTYDGTMRIPHGRLSDEDRARRTRCIVGRCAKKPWNLKVCTWVAHADRPLDKPGLSAVMTICASGATSFVLQLRDFYAMHIRDINFNMSQILLVW